MQISLGNSPPTGAPKPPPARQAGAALEYAEPRAKQSVRLLQQSALLSQRRTRRQRLSRPRGLWPDALYNVRSSRRRPLARHGCIMADWSRAFDDPILLPCGRQLISLFAR